LNNPVADKSLVVTENYSTYLPDYLYIVPAIGITLGRLLGANATVTFLLGRLFNAILFIATCAWTIRIIPTGKMVLMFIALLPMTLQQTASYSYDAPIIASAFVIIAYTLRLFSNERLRIVDWLLYALGSAILFSAKGHAYILLALMPLVCLTKQNRNEKNIKLILTVCFGILFNLIVYYYGVLFPVERIPLEGHGYSEYYSVGYLINNPLQIWILIETTFRYNFEHYLTSMIGGNLGWFNIPAPGIMVWIGMGLLLIGSIKRKSERVILTDKQRLIMMTVFLITVAFIFGGMLLIWTSVESNLIEGIQGRYFLPILPLLLISSQTKDLEIDRKHDKAIIFMDVLWLIVFVLCVINRFQG